MHYPNKTEQYNAFLSDLAKSVHMARTGQYREGLLTLLYEGAMMAKEHAKEMGKWGRDGRLLEDLCQEIRHELDMIHQPVSHDESPLTGLFDGDVGVKEEVPEVEEASPLATGNPYPHRRHR